MSINQDVLDDLASTTGADPDTLKGTSTNPDPVSPEPASITAKADTPQPTETPVTDQVRAQLMNPHSTFTSIQEGVEQTSEMGEVLDSVVENNTISLADVGKITPRFENFGKVFHPQSFTKEPSSVNLIQSIAHMRRAIKLRKEEVTDKFRYFFSESVTEAEEAYKLYKEFYFVELVESLVGLQARLAELKTDKQWHDKQRIYFGGEVVDIASLAAFDLLKGEGKLGEYYQVPAFEAFRTAVDNFQKFTKTQALASPLLDSISKAKSVDEFLDAGNRSDAYGLAIAPMEMLEAVASSYSTKLLHDLEAAAKGGLEKLRELEKEAKIDPSDFTQVQNFVISNGEEFDRSTAYCHYFAETIDTMRRLFLIASAFMDYYQHPK